MQSFCFSGSFKQENIKTLKCFYPLGQFKTNLIQNSTGAKFKIGLAFMSNQNKKIGHVKEFTISTNMKTQFLYHSVIVGVPNIFWSNLITKSTKVCSPSSSFPISTTPNLYNSNLQSCSNMFTSKASVLTSSEFNDPPPPRFLGRWMYNRGTGSIGFYRYAFNWLPKTILISIKVFAILIFVHGTRADCTTGGHGMSVMCLICLKQIAHS